ncbi:hypothetical protein MLD38_034581 [Melastoma candidum]|nr:hypothetical protein MLD38_034581 [Melastoma candidum]
MNPKACACTESRRRSMKACLLSPFRQNIRRNMSRLAIGRTGIKLAQARVERATTRSYMEKGNTATVENRILELTGGNKQQGKEEEEGKPDISDETLGKSKGEE